MDALFTTAQELIEAMRQALKAGQATEEWTVFRGPEGQLNLIAGECGSLESLAWTRGARSAWRVRKELGRIVVEAREGQRRLRLEQSLPGLPSWVRAA